MMVLQEKEEQQVYLDYLELHHLESLNLQSLDVDNVLQGQMDHQDAMVALGLPDQKVHLVHLAVLPTLVAQDLLDHLGHLEVLDHLENWVALEVLEMMDKAEVKVFVEKLEVVGREATKDPLVHLEELAIVEDLDEQDHQDQPVQMEDQVNLATLDHVD